MERQLQRNLNKIENWATSNGFKFSKSKTQGVPFCQLCKQHDDPVLHLYGSPIPVVEESKFLGILFDRKLSSIPHIKYLKAKCLKALNLLRVLSHTSNPAHEVTFPPNYVDLYEQKPKAIKSFGIRMSPLLESANIKPQNIEKHFTPKIPAWCMKPPEILFDYISRKNLNQIHTY